MINNKWGRPEKQNRFGQVKKMCDAMRFPIVCFLCCTGDKQQTHILHGLQTSWVTPCFLNRGCQRADKVEIPNLPKHLEII